MKKFTDWEIKKISIGDKDYPEILTKIKKPPKQIYYRGNLTNELFKKSLAVVGTRQITRYGVNVIEKFIPQLVGEKVTIVSGFMYGVDTVAHNETVNCGGVTVAIMGNGINICYPPENEKLYVKILETGGVVASEYEPNQKAQLWMYRERNRIVSGLSSIGVLVIEAAIKSGSLVTAELAIKQKKKLWAIPGPITSKVSEGTNLLIKNGDAILTTLPSEILQKKIKIDQLKMPELSEIQGKIFRAIDPSGSSIDEISVVTGISIIELNKEITMMGLRGIISESGGKFFVV
jgi:DNA processing protein